MPRTVTSLRVDGGGFVVGAGETRIVSPSCSAPAAAHYERRQTYFRRVLARHKWRRESRRSSPRNFGLCPGARFLGFTPRSGPRLFGGVPWPVEEPPS